MIFYLYSESLQCAFSHKFFGFIINHSLGTTSIEVLQMYCKKKKKKMVVLPSFFFIFQVLTLSVYKFV